MKKTNLNLIFQPIETELNKLKNELVGSVFSNLEIINSINTHILSSSGKLIRPTITLLVYNAISSEKIDNKIFDLATAIEIIHTATLLHDDVIDESDIRRGKLSVNKQWSDKIAILGGDFLLAQALLKLTRLNNPSILELFSQSLIDICEGELFQLNSHNQLPSIEDYLKKSEQKTAKLFALASTSPAILLGMPDEIVSNLRNYGLNLGIAFQILNDLKDFESIDMKSGVITAPVIFGALENTQIQTNIQNKAYEVAMKAIKQTSAIEQTKNLASKYLMEAKSSLASIKESEFKNSLLNLCNLSILH